MAAVFFFYASNMAAVTSCEHTLLVIITVMILVSKQCFRKEFKNPSSERKS